MSTPPIRCPGARVRGWCDGVESVHGGVCGGRCSLCMVKLGVKVWMLLMVWLTMWLGRECEREGLG